MKKLTIFAAFCALVLGSCTENNLDSVTPENNITLPDLTAGFAEGETKTYVHNNTFLRWHEADLITAFYGNSLNRQYKFKGKTGDNSGTFSLIPSGELGTGNDLGAIYAVYPYDENAGINDETREISLTLPATQTYAENSFGKGANTMIAVTENIEDTFLGFKNACGYLKLKLYGEDVTLASVEVKGNNGEKIAGSSTATIEFGGVPTLTMSADATTTVTLDCGEGVVLGTSAETATEFWIVLPETTFEGGITITATDTDGKVFEKSTSKTVAVVRNEIQPMAAIEAICVKVQQKNTIYYTATQKIEPYDKTVFGATYQSSEWDSETGEGIITFDGVVTTIGEMAFYNCTHLTSITTTNNVTTIGEGAFYGSGITSITISDGVLSIGNSVFANCSKLTNITIGSSVTEIGDFVFNDSNNLTSVYLKPSTPPSLGTNSFSGTHTDLQIYVPNEYRTNYRIAQDWKGYRLVGYDFKTGMANNMFKYTATSKVEPYNKTIYGTIYKSSTWNSTTGEGIIAYIGEITLIPSQAFNNCTALTSINIPSTVTSIEGNAFSHCINLVSVNIPQSITYIPSYAFYNCSKLTSITIPNRVTGIGEDAFAQCSSLTEVYCKATTPPSLIYLAFGRNVANRKIYVPTQSVEAYKTANNWKDYANYIVGYDF